jgi:hypothetical protein
VIRHAEICYPKLVRVLGNINPDGIPAVQTYMASNLAKLFEVSTEAMKIRLEQWPARINDRIVVAMTEKLPYLPASELGNST